MDSNHVIHGFENPSVGSVGDDDRDLRGHSPETLQNGPSCAVGVALLCQDEYNDDKKGGRNREAADPPPEERD